MALPAVEERLSHGEPAWFYKGKKQIAMFANHHHDNRVALWCAAPKGAQEMLIGLNPHLYFRPPYVGPRGWVGVYLDVEVDWEDVRDIIQEAYRVIAP
jgi:hypothetical protein